MNLENHTQKRQHYGGEFKEPERHIVKKLENVRGNFTKFNKDYNFLKQIPDGYCEKTGLDERTVRRSMTPLGFAKAFYEANK